MYLPEPEQARAALQLLDRTVADTTLTREQHEALKGAVNLLAVALQHWEALRASAERAAEAQRNIREIVEESR